MNSLASLPPNATAYQVVLHIVTQVLRPNWEVTFAHFNTTPRGSDQDVRRAPPTDLASRMSWGGLVEEARTGDIEALIDRLLAHTQEVEAAGQQSVRVSDVPAWLDGVRPEFSPENDASLLFCSRVFLRRWNGVEVKHIPMMDFRCEPSDRNLQLVVSSMRKLGQNRGVILESGRSYHYYGFELLDDIAWRCIMHRALLLTPFVDPRYIGHRLLAGTARLRVTASRGKPTVPRCVAELNE